MSEILWVPGRRRSVTSFPTGGAANFALASSQYLSIADNAALSMGTSQQFHICMWAKPVATAGASRYLLFKGASFASTDIEYSISSVINLWGFGTGDGTNTSSVTIAVAGVGIWQFISAWVTSAGDLKISVNDGSPASAGVSGKWAFNGAGAFRLGSTTDAGSPKYYDGDLDNVMIWKRELSAAEITSVYNSGNGKTYSALTSGEKTDMVAAWLLDDTGSPSTWLDSHGANTLNNNNGVTSVAGKV